jgi:ADP-ribose pyrophosphatase YjhB (NUDIX family)
MRKQRIYCPYCGKPVVQRYMEGRVRDFCMQCSHVFYENPLPVASSIMVNENREVLLVKRGKDPYKGMWCLPIGFAEADEEVQDAALRELREETGVEGEVVRLVDVDTVDNYYYGSLAIVTYEVRPIGGTPMPGDDAEDTRFFSVSGLPPLAWSSNEKAMNLYIEFHRDTWAMMDSYRHLFPEAGAMGDVSPGPQGQKSFLSNVLVKMIEKNAGEITREWAQEMRSRIPVLSVHAEFFSEMNRKVLKAVRQGLREHGDSFDYLKFKDTGKDIRRLKIGFPDVLNAMALSRKSIWMHVIRKKILSSPLEIYITLELNNRIIFLYDRIIYHMSSGYME